MKVFDSTNTDVYFNLAMEEYLFKNYVDTEYLLLWKNHNSIVLGKHQNIFEEINLAAVAESGIQVARRNTGGGTVFHDEQNLNYSFISNREGDGFADYDQFLTPVIKALNEMGIPAVKRRTSDIAIGEQKISGSAQTVKKGRILHHGTLLYNADLSLLKNLLKTTAGKITSKSVKSVRSEVTNIKKHMTDQSMTMAAFKDTLLEKLLPDGFEKVSLTEEDIQAIQTLVDEKYSQWEWNYGQSPKFSFEKDSAVQSLKGIKIQFDVKLEIIKGRITKCQVMVDGLVNTELMENLAGARYGYEEVLYKLEETRFNKAAQIKIDKLTNCFL
ncbi:biotin/lipoate A/B protein ligase family protein [Acetobacterium sp.]|uniref:lipoate--protein ligase family protein n=1 Tax=Acetobacterium sp. TaxID=1872094 RepID=UPI0035932E09